MPPNPHLGEAERGIELFLITAIPLWRSGGKAFSVYSLRNVLSGVLSVQDKIDCSRSGLQSQAGFARSDLSRWKKEKKKEQKSVRSNLAVP